MTSRPAPDGSAVLFATARTPDGDLAALLDAGGTPLLGRLLEQLQAVGTGRVWVITRPEDVAAVEVAASGRADVVASGDLRGDLDAAAGLAREASGRLLVGAADVLVHQRLLATLLNDPKIHTGALATTDRAGRDRAFTLRSERGRVVSAGSPLHGVSRPTEALLDMLVVGPRDHDGLASAAGALAGLENGRRSDDGAVSLLLVGLVRSGVPVGVSLARRFFHARPLTRDEVGAALDDLSGRDEDRLALESAVKETDGFFTTFFVSPYSKHLARFAARRGWTPNAMTTLSMVIGVLSAAAFATGSRPGMIAGALLLQAAFTIDCVDGQLARYTLNFSKLGAWLDSVFDRGKEYVVYAGLAIGAARGFDQDVWTLAAAALTLQTVRHMIDFSFAASEHAALASAPPLPLDEPHDAPPKTTSVPAAATAAAVPTPRPTPAAALGVVASLDRWTPLRWARRAFLLPIGERFALISLTAALWSPQVTFVALLTWGGIVALYAVTGRILRSVAR